MNEMEWNGMNREDCGVKGWEIDGMDCGKGVWEGWMFE